MSRRRTPATLLLPGGIAVAFLALPLVALLAEAPWGRLPSLLTSPDAREALRVSLLTSVGATLLATALGIPLAWLLAEGRLPLPRLVRALVTLPLVLPPVVGGVLLLLAFGRMGIVGGALEGWFGIRLPFSLAGVVVAQTFVALPFLVLTVEGALRGRRVELEEAAAMLGAEDTRILLRVSLPLVAPSIGSGMLLAWARALGEFGATLTFAGNLPGVTQTLPLAVHSALATDRDAAIALSIGLLAISLGVLLTLRPGGRIGGVSPP